ncbi:putative acetyltransferase [Haloactinospora alba]|uniref:Putative acetyltransferase n=1 Tax=Haloactinospora alba TaxID=405555 RepID=A0A543NJG6_9ACTN|nr:N-acetyltransferase [Haloactinospora alba]TQN31936.1 putative acetyltransferase [Haloactinospora alba]
MLIRRETDEDIPAVRSVTSAAFSSAEAGASDREPVEVTLLDRLRADPGWIPELSLVATRPRNPGGATERPSVVGHVVCTRGWLADVPALGLGPLSVHPHHQRHGAGSALMHAVLAAAEARGERMVALLGEPAYYRRFGFRPAQDHGIEPPEASWGTYFQARLLAGAPFTAGAVFRYAEPFTRL